MRDNWKTTTSDNYEFQYRAGSLAGAELATIIETQESCFEHICAVLRVAKVPKIQYVLCDSPADVALQSGCGEPTAAICEYPATIFAEYTERNRCIGPHEDAHIVARTFGYPRDAFVRESVAMFFDKTWNGVPNGAWVQRFLNAGTYVSSAELCDRFGEYDCNLSYPIAVHWAATLVERFGTDAFLQFYKHASNDSRSVFSDIFDMKLEDFDVILQRSTRIVAYQHSSAQPESAT